LKPLSGRLGLPLKLLPMPRMTTPEAFSSEADAGPRRENATMERTEGFHRPQTPKAPAMFRA